jgi:ribosomal protein S18 acetylase RimI-like enzyme
MEKITYRIIRYFELYEFRKIHLLSLAQYPDNFGTTYGEEFHSASWFLDAIIKEKFQHSFVLGAFTTDNELVGTCGFVAGQQLTTQHRGEIVHLFVEPIYSGKGIGKKLLTHSINRAFGNGRTEQITLQVVSSNDQAINLYKLAGFVEYGRLKDYYKSKNIYFCQVFFVLKKSQYLG